MVAPTLEEALRDEGRILGGIGVTRAHVFVVAGHLLISMHW